MPNVTLPSDLKSIFAGYVKTTPALAGGVTAGVLPQLAIDGRVFSLRRGGAEPPAQLRDSDGRVVTQVDLTIVASHPGLQRVFYAGAYDPTAKDRQPDCRSRDGAAPDPDVPNPQSAQCSTCVQASWGSANRPNSNAQACRAFKPLVVVFSNDPACTYAGEPMVLRVPPASLQALPVLRQQIEAGELPMWMRSVRVTFDYSVAYPKLTFTVLPAPLGLEAGVQVLRAAALAKEKIAAMLNTSWDLPELPDVVRQMLDQALGAPALPGPTGPGALKPATAVEFTEPARPTRPVRPFKPAKPVDAGNEEGGLLSRIEQLFDDKGE